MKRFKKIVFIVCTFAFIAHNPAIHAAQSPAQTNSWYSMMPSYSWGIPSYDRIRAAIAYYAPWLLGGAFAGAAAGRATGNNPYYSALAGAAATGLGKKAFDYMQPKETTDLIEGFIDLGNGPTTEHDPADAGQYERKFPMGQESDQDSKDVRKSNLFLDKAQTIADSRNAHSSLPISAGPLDSQSGEETTPIYDKIEKLIASPNDITKEFIIDQIKDFSGYRDHFKDYWKLIATIAAEAHAIKQKNGTIHQAIQQANTIINDPNTNSNLQHNLPQTIETIIEYLKNILWNKIPEPSKQQSTQQIAWGISERMGRRSTMQDAYAMHEWTDSQGRNHYFFGIYDGHGGKEVADILAKGKFDVSIEPLHNHIKGLGEFNPQDYKKAFNAMQSDIKSKARGIKSGSTAVIAHIIDKDTINIAWAGDSRAIVIDNQGNIIYQTKDHTPETEEDSIKQRGGIVRRVNGIPRVDGLLAVGRSFGDKIIQSLVATPDVHSIDIRNKHNIRAIILACDGVFESNMQNNYKGLSNEAVAQTALDKLNERNSTIFSSLPKDPAKTTKQYTMYPPKTSLESGNSIPLILAARTIRDMAFNNRSGDNISAMIIDLKPFLDTDAP